jgi:hypothetical protein
LGRQRRRGVERPIWGRPLLPEFHLRTKAKPSKGGDAKPRDYRPRLEYALQDSCGPRQSGLPRHGAFPAARLFPKNLEHLGGSHEGNLWRDLDIKPGKSKKTLSKIPSLEDNMYEEKSTFPQVELVEIEELEGKVAPSGSVPIVECR